MFDYEKIPFWWALCPKSDCEMAETCLRHQVCMQAPEKYKRWTCVLPHVYKDGERLINPQLQQEIIDIVHRYAPGVEVEFDKTFLDYDFTRF